jgi:molybdopterin synthase sulfur carrier subunit
VKLLYFAWLKQKIGTGEEELALPEGVATVGALVDWLKTRGPGYGAALEDLSAVRFAVNQEFAALDQPVAEGDEVAFFPPVTGG